MIETYLVMWPRFLLQNGGSAYLPIAASLAQTVVVADAALYLSFATWLYCRDDFCRVLRGLEKEH